MKRVALFLANVMAVILTALTFSYLWSSRYPLVSSTLEEIKAQTNQLKDTGIPALTFVGALLGVVVYVGYVRQKRGWTPNQLARLRRLYIETLILMGLSILFGIFLLVNLALKAPQMERLPLALFS